MFAILIVMLIIPVTAFIVIQIPAVQTSLAKKGVALLSQKINGDVSIDKIYYALPNDVIISNLCIREPSGDTIFHSKKIAISIRARTLLESNIHIKKISLADGQFNIRNISKDSTNLSIALAPLTAPKDSTASAKSTSGGRFKSIQVRNILVDNLDFLYSNPFAPIDAKVKALLKSSPRSMEWNNIDLDNICVNGEGFKYSKQGMEVNLKKLSLNESHGMNINTLSGKISMGTVDTLIAGKVDTLNEIRIKDLQIIDDYSNVFARTYAMRFEKFSDFSDYCNKVWMELDNENSYLDFKTLQSFAPGISTIKLKLFITGLTTGTVSNMQSKSLKVYSGTKKTFLHFAAHLSGLPNSFETMAGFDIKECYTTTEDLATIIGQVSAGNFDKKAISQFAPGERFHFDGSLNGFFEDFVAFGELHSKDMGSVRVDIICRNEREKGYEIIGFVKGNEFETGKFLQNKMLGKLSCDATISALAGKEASTLDIENFNITRFEFNNYTYSRISGHGKLADSEFEGRVLSSDPNLNFMFTGKFALSGKNNNSLYRFDLKLGYANLNALNFDKRDVSDLRMMAVADITKTTTGDIFGKLTINHLAGTVNKNIYNVGNILVNSLFSDKDFTISLNSSFADVSFHGTAPINTFISDLMSLSVGEHLSNLFPDRKKEVKDAYTFRLVTYNMKPVCEFLMPELYVGDSTRLSVDITKSGDMQVDLHSDLLALKNKYIKSLSVKIDNRDSAMNATVISDMLQSGDLMAKNDTIKAKIRDNLSDLVLSFDNKTKSATRAKISAAVAFPQKGATPYDIMAFFRDSDISLNGGKWNIDPSSLYYTDKKILVNNFKISNRGQSLEVNGTLSSSVEDTLNVALKKFDAALVNPFIGMPLNVQGLFSGTAQLFDSFGNTMGMLIDVKGDSVYVFNKEVGRLDISSTWNETDKKFDLNLVNRLHDRIPLNFTGIYKPSTNTLKAKASLREFTLVYFEPLLTSLVSTISGSISGDLTFDGPLDRLKISSSGSRLNNLGVKLLFTQVPYTLDGPLDVSEKGITFNNITIKDKYGHSGSVRGGVKYDYFNDIKLDTRISVNNILGLNTTAVDNSSFYGRAFATGMVRLTGPMNKLMLDINITTNPNSTIHIPLSSSTKEQTSLLTFVSDYTPKVNAYDSLIVLNSEKKSTNDSEFGVNVCINATPDAEVLLEINKSVGDMIKARGSGQIAIAVNQAKDLFDIKGDYNIDEGSYKFVFLGLASRDFIINPGGTINFNGDIMQSDLNLTATYRTKASIGTLIADTTSVSSRRTVDCGIGISGKLTNPQLKFDIDIPDLDPTTQGKVESALNTEDKRLKQLLTVLLSGSFLPDEQSGIVNNTTVLYSNASEIMSNQLNNVFRQLDIPLDLGFNYQPGENGRDIFDVAISTQLFNNRVTINGNIGNKQYLSSSTSDVVGDVDVEIKLNESGKLRLNLFSHSADQYSNYLDQTQRNGAGLVYQEEFNSFHELWRKIFWSKKRREDYDAALREERRLQRDTLSVGQVPTGTTAIGTAPDGSDPNGSGPDGIGPRDSAWVGTAPVGIDPRGIDPRDSMATTR